MRWRKWQTILDFTTGKRDTGFNEENEKRPRSKIQDPEKSQAPRSKAQAAVEDAQPWMLDLLWILDLGSWIFCARVPPRHYCPYWFAISRILANQPHLARQPLPVHC